MTQKYSSTIKQHYHYPRHAGKIIHPTYTFEQINSLCGDETKVYLKIHDGTIADISHETRGCMIAVAAASVLSVYIQGKKMELIQNVNLENISKLLDTQISKTRESCATLLLQAFKKINLSEE